MNEDKYAIMEIDELDEKSFDFDDLERKLEADLELQMSELEILEEDKEKIANPDALGEVVLNVVWEQFINQIGVVAGEDFIKENRGMNLDLRKSAHIQTTENFAKGEIASHNTQIDYQQRYDRWQSKFVKDENGNILTHKQRTGQTVENVHNWARDQFDKDRPTGSEKDGTAMDHTIAARRIVRDPEANAHLTEEEQIQFANSDKNLNLMNAKANKSKSDLDTDDWLDTPNSKGQLPEENPDFGLTPEEKQRLRDKNKEAKEEYNRVKEEGEKRSIETGKQSQKEEAFRIGGKALRSAVMGLLAALVKDIICQLILWWKSSIKKFSTFLDSIKAAIHNFIGNLKQHLLTVGNTVLTTIATAIVGPVIGMIKKAWIFLKQGYKSLKEAINYVRAPENKNKPFSILMLEVGKIVIAGLTAGGAILLGETISKSLMTIPILAFEIPLLGSLASILGIFFGALISGLIGAIALNLIDRAVSKRLMKDNVKNSIEKRNEILAIQTEIIAVNKEQVNNSRVQTASNVSQRHREAYDVIKDSVQRIVENSKDIEQKEINDDAKSVETSKSDKNLEDIFSTLNNL